MFSFPEGLGEIPATLARTLGPALRLGHTVNAARRQAGGWELEFSAGGQRSTETFAAVVCALPADALAALDFAGLASGLRQLREIEHPPVCSIFTGFRREDVPHPLDGFGLLVPAVEHRSWLGTLFSSTLFPGRAPDGCVGLTSFVGGMRDPALTSRDDAGLVALIQGELAQILGVRGAPVFTHVQRWPRAIPQYALGYQRFQDAIAAAEAAAPGLFIGGNCRDGISLANCIASGGRLAQRAAGFGPGAKA
jgi:oxygen-dependent protoporphyrinogen oxidase